MKPKQRLVAGFCDGCHEAIADGEGEWVSGYRTCQRCVQRFLDTLKTLLLERRARKRAH